MFLGTNRKFGWTSRIAVGKRKKATLINGVTDIQSKTVRGKSALSKCLTIICFMLFAYGIFYNFSKSHHTFSLSPLFYQLYYFCNNNSVSRLLMHYTDKNFWRRLWLKISFDFLNPLYLILSINTD